MKKFTSRNWLLVMMIFTITTSTSVIAQKQYDPEKLFSVDQLKEDFLFTKTALEKYHPGLFWYVNKERFDAFSDSLLATIDHPMTEIELYNVILPMFQIVREKHGEVFLSDKGHERFKNEVKRFPFSLRCIDSRLFINKNGSSDTTLVRGTELLTINERSSESIISEMKRRLISDGYNTTGIVRYDIEDEFSYHYYLNINQKEEFKLQIRRIGKTEIEDTYVSGEKRNVYDDRISKSQKEKKKYPLEFQILDSLNTAVFTLDTFTSNKESNQLGLSTADYISTVFEQLQAKPHIKNLIIDVRQNGGGDPNSGILLLSYLSDQKNRFFKSIERSNWAWNFKKGSTGTYFGQKMYSDILKPKDERFTGNVYLLTGGKTYSLGSLFAASVANFTNAVVIGEETGGGYHGSTGGTSKKKNTPNTKLNLMIPQIRFLLNVTGQPEGRGLLPDHEVLSTYDDFLHGKDTEMEYTLELIRQRTLNDTASR